jgi:hypothetical protein
MLWCGVSAIRRWRQNGVPAGNETRLRIPHLHVRWDGVGDDARVSVGVDDTDGGDVLGGALPDGAEVLGRVEEDDQVGEVGIVGDGLDSKAKGREVSLSAEVKVRYRKEDAVVLIWRIIIRKSRIDVYAGRSVNRIAATHKVSALVRVPGSQLAAT